MKTLDEVIKQAEHCNEYPDCTGCVYAGIHELCGLNWATDALYYLREYRNCHENLIRNCNRHEELYNQYRDMIDELEKNDPLTWDELKQMERKPVWVEYYGYMSCWEIIERIGNSKLYDGQFIETHMSILHKEDIGKTWQAYRKER